uniref:Small ribosomal subunit protein uS4c n=1 Tax=Polytoma uvella TaxID=40532 RepID=A0A1L2M5C5_9CHLO|nr:ribosomal protein S4 [Polytoma uvella]
MVKYLGPRLRIIRRLGQLRGLTRKKPFKRVFRGKIVPPGQHGIAKVFKTKRRSDSLLSDYRIRLKIKQRLRFNYGLTELQLINYVRLVRKKRLDVLNNEVDSTKKTRTLKALVSTKSMLIQLIEMRLDNIVFRLNMAPTIPAARQLVNHGHILVNNQKVDYPSYVCKQEDVISVKVKEKSLSLVNKNINEFFNLKVTKKRIV